jgi:hypothetical protein
MRAFFSRIAGDEPGEMSQVDLLSMIQIAQVGLDLVNVSNAAMQRLFEVEVDADQNCYVFRCRGLAEHSFKSLGVACIYCSVKSRCGKDKVGRRPRVSWDLCIRRPIGLSLSFLCYFALNVCLPSILRPYTLIYLKIRPRIPSKWSTRLAALQKQPQETMEPKSYDLVTPFSLS